MGRLTTHVLDTARGRPAAGVPIELYRVTDAGAPRELVCRRETNTDGRTDEPLLAGQAFSPGEWEIVFRIGEYFADLSPGDAGPGFLDRVPVRFHIAEDGHYHVPLLVSPWSYTTYRGS